MLSFGWKKSGKKQSANKLTAFNEKEVNEQLDEAVDWLTATRPPKVLRLEDVESKSKRLVEEGITLAENERLWEAIGRWNSALTFTPEKYKVHDMLAQAYTMVGEIYPALQSAVTATKLAPWWSPGHQTHGRALLGLGEVAMSIKAFSRAIHIQPDNMELWKNDLEWAVNLLRKHTELEKIAEEKEKLVKNKEEEAKNQGFLLEEIVNSELDSVKEAGNSSTVSSSCIDSSEYSKISKWELDPLLENVLVDVTPYDRTRPPITCTSKKRKHELETDFDPRFCKDLAVCDQSGSIVTKPERIEMHPSRMVCYRR